jgi:hypothetical protein
MEQVYQTVILKKISDYLVRISLLKSEINNLHLEKELLLCKKSETERDKAVENIFHLHF